MWDGGGCWLVWPQPDQEDIETQQISYFSLRCLRARPRSEMKDMRIQSTNGGIPDVQIPQTENALAQALNADVVMDIVKHPQM